MASSAFSRRFFIDAVYHSFELYRRHLLRRVSMLSCLLFSLPRVRPSLCRYNLYMHNAVKTPLDPTACTPVPEYIQPNPNDLTSVSIPSRWFTGWLLWTRASILIRDCQRFIFPSSMYRSVTDCRAVSERKYFSVLRDPCNKLKCKDLGSQEMTTRRRDTGRLLQPN